MSKITDSLRNRAKWYILGLVLFFGPFALYPRLVHWLFGVVRIPDIHAMCLRMPIGFMLIGRIALHGLLSASFLAFVFLVLSALMGGPVFCGRLCAAGALPEYLSRLVPKKFKIDWRKAVNPAPIKYGFFAAFLISPFVASALTCGFCQFAFLQNCTAGGFGVLGSTTILTVFLWLVLFGLFAQGGRGFCMYMCPIGAFQTLLHSLGSRLPFTFKLKHSSDQCASCATCVRECPMGALELDKDELKYNLHNCLTCRHCVNVCPKGAISYGTGEAGWKKAVRTQTGGTGIGHE